MSNFKFIDLLSFFLLVFIECIPLSKHIAQIFFFKIILYPRLKSVNQDQMASDYNYAVVIIGSIIIKKQFKCKIVNIFLSIIFSTCCGR